MKDKRISNLKQRIKKEKLDAVLISSVPNITYLTGYSNFFKEERDGFCLITKDGNYILTHSIYSKGLEGKIPGFKVIEISRREPPEKVMKKLMKNTNAQIGIEEHDLRVYEYKKINAIFKNLKNFDLKIKRSVKDEEEVKLITKACWFGDQVFSNILDKIKLGISEKQLVYEIEDLIKKMGCEPSFRTIVAFGENAAFPHHQSGQTKLQNNQFVLMDFGVKFENYCSDMTRTVFFGKPTKDQIKIYKTVLDSQQKAIGFINNCLKNREKIIAKDVDKVARDYIRSSGYPNIPYSLGHGIGLEVHEHPHISPKSKETLEEGMVFSIEPGIYIERFGGVRIEDLYVLEAGKITSLTHSNSRLIKV